ncbi:AcrR family transcriptional regulator [Streptosporangium becharense]|uniref:AcrR family transcriptional regulator n=1 Tax=Streptosporangium becharense TaxID=1816182 RepID=A0A7W9IAK9_9ACTN|nr:TetR/AcrR family transcriptional regulator [Streptosporangium becharense]MBB2914180.1 AcrR family transcriptional regulator [Streptosporangium becharense]MBB5817207.1 AcrR family transcriptional regulator [Streptosporangium becharense]
MTQSTSRGPYAKTAAIRRRIVEACVDAFGQTGFYGATMKDVAKRAGISYTGLLHHFSSKEELLAAVLELRDERGSEYLESAHALDPDSNPVETLRGMLAVIVDNELQPGLMELHCVLSGEATSPGHPAHAYYAERYRMLRRFFAMAFRALAERGELHSASDPETLATMTIALINGLQAQWLFDRDSVQLESAIREFLAAAVPALAGTGSTDARA